MADAEQSLVKDLMEIGQGVAKLKAENEQLKERVVFLEEMLRKNAGSLPSL